MQTTEWTVEIDNAGRAGSIYYKEGKNVIKFEFEIGGEIVAAIWLPDKNIWEVRYAWALGRREEIINRVIQEVLCQKAPNSSVEIDEKHNIIYIK